jgi:hypothetical protein
VQETWSNNFRHKNRRLVSVYALVLGSDPNDPIGGEGEGRGALISYLMGARRRRIEGADEERGNGPTKTWAPGVARRRRGGGPVVARERGEGRRERERAQSGRMGEVKAARRDGAKYRCVW